MINKSEKKALKWIIILTLCLVKCMTTTKQKPVYKYDPSMTRSSKTQFKYSKGGHREGHAKKISSLKKSVLQPENTIVLNTQYKVKKELIEYIIPEDISKEDSYIIELNGKGQLKIEVFDNKKTILDSVVINLTEQDTSSFIVFDSKRFLRKKDDYFKIKNLDIDENSSFSFLLTKGPGIELEFGTHVQVLAHFACDVHLQVKLSDQNEPTLKVTRHQFFAQTELDSQKLIGDERIGLFINGKTTTFPTQYEFDFKASANDGVGVIKSINSNNPHFCKIGSECLYKVTVASNDIDVFWFYPTVMSYENDIEFYDKLVLLEELESGEIISYQISSKIFTNSYFFELTPIEHGTLCKLNIGTPLSFVDNPLHIFNTTVKSSFYLTPLQYQRLKAEDPFLYISCNSADQLAVSTFQLRIYAIEDKQLPMLETNGRFSGKPIHREVINYFFDFKQKTNEKIDVGLTLSVINGSGLIVVKECLTDDHLCTLNQNDISLIQSKDKSIFKGKSIFRFTTVETKVANGKLNSLLLSFLCKPTTQNLAIQIPDSVLVSETCKFAVALWFDQEDKNKELFYTLATSSSNNHQQLFNKQSVTVKSSSPSTYFYKLPVISDESVLVVKIQFRLFMLTGKGSMFISHTNPYPEEHNCDAQLNFRHETKTSIQTKSYSLDFDIKSEDLKNDNNLYVSIKTDLFSILDILPVIIHSKNQKNQTEEILPEKSYNRLINSVDLFIDRIYQKVYYKNFILNFPKSIFVNNTIQNVEINLNSNIYGLRLCVLTNKDKIKNQIIDSCDFTTSLEHLKLSKDQTQLIPDSSILISVQKFDDASNPIQKFPIQFELFTSVNDSESQFELNLPGSTLRSFSEKGKDVKILFDLTNMSNDAIVFVTSEDPLLEVRVYKNMSGSDVLVSTLNSQTFGFHVVNATEFKSLYCEQDCKLTAILFTRSNVSHAFAFTFTYDSRPLVIKDGLVLKTPNNVNLYFLYETKTEGHTDFTFYSKEEKSVGFARVIKKDMIANEDFFLKEITEIKFDMKSDIGNSIQLVFSENELKTKNGDFILYLIQPKFNFLEDKNGQCVVGLDDQKSAKIYVRSGIVKLEGFTTVSDTLSSGEIKYYSVQFKGEIDFSLTTLNVQGQVVLLIQKGDNFPTIERYWKSSKNPQGDLVIVKAEDYKTGSEDSSFIIGVYSPEQSSFSLLYMPDFKNLISVEMQKMTELKLEADKFYYFDFYAQESSVESLVYSEENDIQIALLDYNPQQKQDLITMISDETNYFQKSVLHQGEPPLVNLNNFSKIKNSHLVVRLLSLGRSAKAGLLFFNPDKPIHAPSENRFHFILQPNQEVIFMVKLDNRYRKVGIDFKVNFGKVSFGVSDRSDGFSSEIQMNGKVQKYIDFEMSKEQKDIILFNTVFIKVTSQKFSRFSALVKPQEKFKLLKINEPEIVYTNPDSDGFLYFGIYPDQLKYIDKIELCIHSVSYFGNQPELLFTSSNAQIPDSSSNFQPMPVIDFQETNLEELRETIYQVQPSEGFYIIKLPKNVNKLPFKIIISFNDVRSIEPNGLTRGILPETTDKKHSYSMFLNEPGEYRLVWESCSPIQIDDFQFIGDDKKTNATFESNMFQSYPVIFLDETLRETSRAFEKVRYPILRGQITGPGKLTFTISPGILKQSDELSTSSAPKIKNSYVLMSEFKPSTSQLILKDYIEIFRDEMKFSTFYVSHNFIQTKSKLKLTFLKPSFKIQLFDDYPSLSKIQMKFKVYLFNRPEFIHDVKVCGVSALDDYKKSQQTVFFEMTPDEARKLDGSQEVDVIFGKEALDMFAKSEKLNVACYVSVRFFENEEEEWKVTLDLKYTNVPYVLLTINNEYVSIEQLKFILAIVIFVFLFIGFVLYSIFNCKENDKRKRIIREKKVIEDDDEDEEREDEEQGHQHFEDDDSGASSMMNENEKLEIKRE